MRLSDLFMVLIREHFLLQICLEIVELYDLNLAPGIATLPADEPVLRDKNFLVEFGVTDLPHKSAGVHVFVASLNFLHELPDHYGFVLAAGN